MWLLWCHNHTHTHTHTSSRKNQLPSDRSERRASLSIPLSLSISAPVKCGTVGGAGRDYIKYQGKEPESTTTPQSSSSLPGVTWRDVALCGKHWCGIRVKTEPGAPPRPPTSLTSTSFTTLGWSSFLRMAISWYTCSMGPLGWMQPPGAGRVPRGGGRPEEDKNHLRVTAKRAGAPDVTRGFAQPSLHPPLLLLTDGE